MSDMSDGARGTMKHFSTDDFAELAQRMRKPFHDSYFAMYSSVYGGVVIDPVLMTVPVDDHLVHRGDGIFETLKCVDGRIYNMAAHMARLGESAAKLEYRLPCGLDEIAARVTETVRTGGQRECSIRVLVSRGQGSLGVNPYDCDEPGLYVVVSRRKPSFMETHPEGAVVATSRYAAKPAYIATVKNCNYLLNALMKKESIEAGVDFVVGFDDAGCLAEGPTENMGIVTREGRLVFPRLGAILAGTTMMRVADLARQAIETGVLSAVAFDDIMRDDIVDASEILIVGTTPDVTAVREFDGAPAGSGPAGNAFRSLSGLLLSDIRSNAEMHTVVFD